jgi:hypothetical protein
MEMKKKQSLMEDVLLEHLFCSYKFVLYLSLWIYLKRTISAKSGEKNAQPSPNIICADALIINWKIKKGADKENSKRGTGNLPE